jgi:glucose-6-phosphate 1-dehydrogenase
MKTIEPCTLVIFGARGNLSRIKLIPALFRLETMGRLPCRMAILACGLEKCTRDQWLDEVASALKAKFPTGIDESSFERFRDRLHYHASPPDDVDAYTRMKHFFNIFI